MKSKKEDYMRSLGTKIYSYRKAKKMSREEFCEEEEEITIRNLGNIERGKVLPNLITLQYIAKRLEINLSELVDEEQEKIPERYSKLKYRLLRIPLYGDPEAISQQKEIFNEIEEKLFDYLPNSEKLAIEILKGVKQTHLEEKLDFSKSILDNHFSHLINKTAYDLNNLLLIQLYFSHFYHEPYEEASFEPILNQLIFQSQEAIDMEALLIILLFTHVASIYVKNKKYKNLLELTHWAQSLMKRTEDYQKKPIIDMIEGKYWLFEQGEKEKAWSKYENGASYAEMVGNDFLAEKIREEYQKDLQKIETK